MAAEVRTEVALGSRVPRAASHLEHCRLQQELSVQYKG